MAYAECFVLMLPLRGCATRCRVCLKTACTMRHRLIECLSACSPSFRAGQGCGCELDETYFPESFKGNHAKGSFTMPRPSRHRGEQVRRRGLPLERICVMTVSGMPRAVFAMTIASRSSVLASPAKSLAAPCAASPGRYAADIPAALARPSVRAAMLRDWSTTTSVSGKRPNGESRSPSMFAMGALGSISPFPVATHAQWDDLPKSSPMTASGILGGATVVS